MARRCHTARSINHTHKHTAAHHSTDISTTQNHNAFKIEENSGTCSLVNGRVVACNIVDDNKWYVLSLLVLCVVHRWPQRHCAYPHHVNKCVSRGRCYTGEVSDFNTHSFNGNGRGNPLVLLFERTMRDLLMN